MASSRVEAMVLQPTPLIDGLPIMGQLSDAKRLEWRSRWGEFGFSTTNLRAWVQRVISIDRGNVG